VILEAQASGIPVIVTDQGARKRTSSRAGPVTWFAPAIRRVRSCRQLIDNPYLLEGMKRNARKYVQGRSFEAAYLKLWDSYRTCEPLCRSSNTETCFVS